MTRARVAGCAAVVLGATSLFAPTAALADPAKPRAIETSGAHSVRLFNEARVLYQRGQYRGAITKLEAALVLDPEGTELVYNLALVHEKLGEIEAAQRYYRAYLRMEDDPELQAKAQVVLQRLEGLKKDVGAAPRPLDEHAPAPRSHARPWAFVAAASSAAAVLTGTAFGIGALAAKPGRDAMTGDGVAYAALEGDAARAHRLAIVADVSFAVAAVAGVAAVYLFLRPEPGAKTSATLRASVSHATLGVRF
jgi:tetratricopeptide (TPR) repeat protein